MKLTGDEKMVLAIAECIVYRRYVSWIMTSDGVMTRKWQFQLYLLGFAKC